MTYTNNIDGVSVEMTEDEIAEVNRRMSEWDVVCGALRRRERDSFLASTDWWVMPDRTATADQLAYRQALRDITAQAGFPTNVTWPTKPEEV